LTLPLEGIRVLDLTVFQQGTYSTAMLADLGADVIKIEGPDSPDLGRWSMAVRAQTPLNAYFHAHNRSKRGIVLDLKHERGRAAFYRLVELADVFVSNLRRPALERLGLGYAALSQINPKLVYGRASGYGPNGPDADLGSMDILGLARSGMMNRIGEPDGPPKPPAGVAIADHVGAMSLAFGLMVALFHRERTGEGQEVDASLLGGQICIQSFNITDYLWSKDVRGRAGRGRNPTWNVYAGSDGHWFAIGMNRQHYWAPFCAAIGRPEWTDDPRYATLSARLENSDALCGALDALFATRPAAAWVSAFSAADLLATPVNDYAGVAADPQSTANGYITEVEQGQGLPPVQMVGLPVSFSKTPGRVRSLAPEFGQHTEEVLLEAGFDWEEVAALRSVGAIGPRA
jgi:crotonobetainyl-CoA:carnitine CoA-transferase CaiB-like acyl-CoA transferase